MNDRKSRLESLEAMIADMAAFLPHEVEKVCADCGVEYSMKPCARYCEECAAWRRGLANRMQQQRRRRREKRQRQIAAGLLKGTSFFSILVSIPCAHCGDPFKPQRTTGRYCSTRCRVAAHRARKAD
jgi:hypothetical protein